MSPNDGGLVPRVILVNRSWKAVIIRDGDVVMNRIVVALNK